jgi:hypothetical protein
MTSSATLPNRARFKPARQCVTNDDEVGFHFVGCHQDQLAREAEAEHALRAHALVFQSRDTSVELPRLARAPSRREPDSHTADTRTHTR